jgi:hypothetical protein
VPTAIPVTIPVDEPIVAIVVLPLLQVPPVVASLKVTVDPTHTESPVRVDKVTVTRKF